MLHAFFFFACNETVKSVCQSLFFACRSVHCVSFTCMECVGNVCEAKKQLTRVCSGDRHLSFHLTFTRAIASSPAQCLCRRRSGKGKPKIYLPFDHSKAWDFSDEEIASWRRSPVTGSKYSVVDRDRTYTPTARRRPPVHCRQCSPGLVTILATQEQTWRKTMVSVSSYNMKRTSLSLQKSCKQR